MTNPSPTSIPSQPRTERLLAWSRLPLLLLLGLTFFLGCFELADYDIWWHLRTGQLIPVRGLPITDWFSFTSADNTWIDVHWGFQLVIAWIYARAKARGLVLMTAGVAMLAIAVCLTAYRRTWPVTVQIVVWLPALLLMSSRFYARPEIFTLLFTAIFLTVLFHAETRPSLLWLLPPLQIVWANMHGLFIFGPILLAMYFVEAVLRIDKSRGLFRHLLPVTILTPLACMVSPYSFANVLLVFELWRKMRDGDGRIYRENIAELTDLSTFWHQGGFHNAYVWMLVVMLALSALSILVAWRAILVERRVFRMLPLVAFGWLSLQATRNGNHFALVAGTVVCWNFGSLAWPEFRARRWTWLLNSALILGVAYYVVSGHWYLLVGGHRRFGLEERPDFYSWKTMEKAGVEGMPDRAAIFHMGHAANYIFVNGPERKVLMDGRLEVHDESMFRTYLELEDSITSGRNWDAQLQSMGVNVVIADGEYNHPVQAALFAHPQWRCLSYDDLLALFLRKNVPVPPGLTPFDFRAALFQAGAGAPIFDSPLPQPATRPRWLLLPPDSIYPGPDDRAAERAYYLGLNLVAQPQSELANRRAVAWYAAQFAQKAVRRRPWSAEAFRVLGASMLLASNVTPGPEEPAHSKNGWDTTLSLLSAMGMYALQQAIQCSPDDYTANFHLHETLARLGAKDRSLIPLRRLSQRPAVNRTQIKLAEALPGTIAQREKEIAEARATLDLTDQSFAGLEAYAKAGILGEGLDRLELAQIERLAPEQADRVGTWSLLIGEPEQAKRVFETLVGSNTFPPALLELRLGTLAHVTGDAAEARRHYLKALEGDPKLVEANYAMAILSLTAGDREQFELYVDRGLQANPTRRQRENLEDLAELLEHEDDEG